MTTLTTTTARPPAKVAVTGLGPVGHLAAQIFASCGYDVVACDPVVERRQIAVQHGIGRAVSRLDPADPDYGGKLDLVVECSGHEQATLDGCLSVRKRGEVVLVGIPHQPRTDILAQSLLRVIFHRYVVLRSGWEWEVPRHRTDFQKNSIFDNLAAALRWLSDRRVRVHDLYAVVPPREAQHIYQDLLHQRAARLATVFDWTDCP
jgi:threonine dehydrogenase-like Zn-dependent dehydrogenase